MTFHNISNIYMAVVDMEAGGSWDFNFVKLFIFLFLV